MKDLETIRKSKGLSFYQLAELADIAYQTISNIECRRLSNPQPETRNKIEQALRQRVNWLATMGVDNAEQHTWEELESQLRQTIIDAYKLSSIERTQFIDVAREYLRTFESIIQLADYEHGEILLPPDVYQEIKNKAKGG